MKPLLLILFFGLTAQVKASGHIYKSSDLIKFREIPGDTIDVVVAPGEISAADLELLQYKMKSISNVINVCFCSNLNAFVLRSFKTFYADEYALMEEVQKRCGDIIVFKKEADPKWIIETCTFSPENNYDVMKNFLIRYN